MRTQPGPRRQSGDGRFSARLLVRAGRLAASPASSRITIRRHYGRAYPRAHCRERSPPMEPMGSGSAEARAAELRGGSDLPVRRVPRLARPPWGSPEIPVPEDSAGQFAEVPDRRTRHAGRTFRARSKTPLTFPAPRRKVGSRGSPPGCRRGGRSPDGWRHGGVQRVNRIGGGPRPTERPGPNA